MRFLELGIVLLLVGVVLSFTPAFGGLGGGLMYVGWICLAIGIVFAILHFVGSGRGRRVL